MATAQEERPASSTSSFNHEEVNKLMSQGKRHFVCNEIVEAVKSFQEACRLLGEKYGQTANECGDAYFQYGKSLLELARVENGVLGNALNEVQIEESDSDEETKLNTVGPKIKDIPLEEKQAVKESVQSAMEEKETANKEGEGITSEAKEDVAGGSGETKEPASEEAAMESEEALTKESEEATKESEEATKESAEATKESEPAAMESEQATKESEEATKESEEATKESEEATRESEQAAMESEQTTKESEEATKEATKESEQAAMESEQATKESQEATKESEEATKESEEATKESEQAAKESQKATKESEQATKESEEATKESKEGCSEEKKEIDESEEIVGEDEGVGEDIGEDEDDKTEAQNGEKDSKDDGEDEPIDADGVPTIQLAWEMLELARIIFKRVSNQESQLKLAQTHLMLGEINMEQEQFTDGVSETTKCLNIQKTLLQPDDRRLAETYYTLGLAYGLSVNYDKSAEHYSSAIEVIELRIKNIKARVEKEEEHDKGKGKASVQDPYVKDRNELAELEELLPEIKERCLDAKNENEKVRNEIKKQIMEGELDRKLTKPETMFAQLAMMGVMGITSVGFGTSSSTNPSTSTAQVIEPKEKADDISHLVRRTKRKPEEEEQTEQNQQVPTKKSRQDDESTPTQNGDSGTSEGVAMEQQ